MVADPDRVTYPYKHGSGTSFAAPHVAGAWAVLRQVKPNASVDEIERAFKTTGATIIDSKNGIAKTRININNAINFIAPELWLTPILTNLLL